jgi:hypothetical protein
MISIYVGVTDGGVRFLSQRPDIPEVNFWQPIDTRRFGALAPRELSYSSTACSTSVT